MYSVVLMVAATSGGDVAGFGGHKDSGGCTGAVASASCHGCSGGGFLGMRNGGGLFTGENQYWLNGFGHVALREEVQLVRDSAYRPADNYGGECPGVYYLRLQRDGWNLVERKSHSEWNDTTTFEKLLSGGWVLRKSAHEQVGAPPGKGCYWDEHALVHPESGTTVDGKDWEWADLDGKRLVWAQHGQLWAGYVRKGGLHDSRCLRDFNDMKFEAIAAPY